MEFLKNRNKRNNNSHIDEYKQGKTYNTNDSVYINGSVYTATNTYVSSNTGTGNELTDFISDMLAGHWLKSNIPMNQWETGLLYNEGDLVINNGVAHRCNITHVSSNTGNATNDFSADVISGKWTAFAKDLLQINPSTALSLGDVAELSMPSDVWVDIPHAFYPNSTTWKTTEFTAPSSGYISLTCSTNAYTSGIEVRAVNSDGTFRDVSCNTNTDVRSMSVLPPTTKGQKFYISYFYVSSAIMKFYYSVGSAKELGLI